MVLGEKQQVDRCIRGITARVAREILFAAYAGSIPNAKSYDIWIVQNIQGSTAGKGVSPGTDAIPIGSNHIQIPDPRTQTASGDILVGHAHWYIRGVGIICPRTEALSGGIAQIPQNGRIIWIVYFE